MCEEWQDIPDFEGHYQASTLGRIKSVDWVVPWSRWGGVRTCKGRIMRLSRTGQTVGRIPYKVVTLTKLGVPKMWYVHRLVAITWLGPVPPGCEVRHGANGHADNSVANLSYGTHSDNELDKLRDGTGKYRRVKRSDDVEFASLTEAAEQSGCHQGNISTVCRGNRKSAGGYGWTYCDD